MKLLYFILPVLISVIYTACSRSLTIDINYLKILMNRFLFTLVLIFSLLQVSGQVNDPEHYLRKSRHQKLAATLMISIGSAALLAGGLYNISDNITIGNDTYTEGNKSVSTGELIIVGGLATMFGSVALFNAAYKNKKRAALANVFIKQEHSFVLKQQGSMSRTSFPAVGIKINL